MKKICFIASSGGHFEQLMMLKPLMKKYDSLIVTEKTNYSVSNSEFNTYYLHQVNRREKSFIFRMIGNSLKAVISTGALATIPMCLFGKIFGKKIIFIESFAKVNSQTLTGKLVYKFADQFYVQWDEMKKFYPNAICKGGIY